MQLLAFIRESDTLTDEHVAAMAEACTYQHAKHVCTPWRLPITVCFPRALAQLDGLPWVPRLVFLDNREQANALGYHTVGPDGIPYAKVFVDEVLHYGGGILRDKGNGSVSVTASHEAVETIGDPGVDRWQTGPALVEGSQFAVELCDQVQRFSYTVPTKRAGLVSVSDFVFPAALGLPGGPRDKFDYLGKLDGPFKVAPGGYQIVRNSSGHVSNVWGSSLFAPHEASRMARRGGIQ